MSTAPAHAGLLGSLGTVVKTTTTNLSTTTTGLVGQVLPPPVTQAVNIIPADYDPLTPLEQLLGGEAGLGTVLEQALCKPITEVAELAALAGLNPIGDGLTSLACNASILEYRFFTRFRRADGSNLDRTHVATLGVPTLLNVDEDSGYDLIGTITVTGANTVGLTIDRVPGETATLPLSIEAVLRDGGGGLLGSEHLAFGYDARMDRAPGRFVMATPINTILAPSPDFQLNVSQTGRGERIALIGGVFDGTLLARVNPAEVRIDYSKSPDTATLRARVGDDVAATLTTNRPGPATISGRIVDVNDESRFTAALKDLPSSLSLTADTSGALDVTYSASARVAEIRGNLERLNNAGLTPTLLQKAVLSLDDVPTGLAVSQSGDGGSVTTSGGPIGRTAVGIANGEPQFLAGEPAYVNLDDDGTLQSTAVQLPGLERATFSLGDAVSVGAKLSPTPLLARIVEPGRDIEARVQQLPGEFDLAVDLTGGSVDFDGHGDGIDQITLSADSDTPLFSRATKLRGTLEGIPAVMHATLETADGAGGVVIDGSGPLGGVELVASNGPETLPPGTGQGAIYRDVTGGDFLISARVLDLRELRFTTAPSTSVRAVTRGGPFSLDLLTDDLDVDGQVLDLPADATFGLDQEAGKLTFTGADGDGDPQGIDLLTLTAVSAGGLFGEADRLDARIEDLPASLELTLSPDDDRVGVTSTNPIGSIEVVAANRAIDRAADLPAAGEQGVRYVDEAGEFAVGARVLGLKKIIATLGTGLGLETETAGGLFTADVRTDELDAVARVQDLPAKLLANLDLDAGRLTLDGRNADDEPQTIERLTVDAHSAAGIIGRATHLKADVGQIPSQLALDLAQSGDGLSLTANEPIGSIEVAAADRPVDFTTDLPLGGEQGAKFVDTTPEYLVSARVRQLKSVTATLGDAVTISTEIESGPFGIRYVTDELNALARIQDLPSQLTATIDLANGKITTDGSSPIELLTFDAAGTQPVFGEATHIAARIEGIPQSLMLDLAQTGTGARLQANEPIRSVKVAAANGPVDLDADVPANQGVTFIDEGGVFKLAARIEELRLLDAALGDDIRIEAKTKGGPFDAVVRTDDLDADAAIRDLPQDVLIALDAAAGRLTYTGKDGDGNPKGVDSLTASVRGTAAFFDRARRFDLEILKLAPTVTVDLAQDGSGASINTDEPIESIAFSASDDPARTLADALAFIGDPQGAVFRDTPGEFLLAGRVLDLEELTFGLSGEAVQLTSKLRSTPFKVSIASGNLDATARIVDLPEQATVALDLDQGALTYAGRDGDGNPKSIDAITFAADAPASDPLFGAATKLRGNILQVPGNLAISFSQTGGAASLQTTNGAIGTIEFLATNQTGPETFPSPQGVRFVDRTVGSDREFEVAARVLGLEKLVATLGSGLSGGPIVLDTKTAGGLFELDVATDDFTATGEIADLPSTARIEFDLDAPADQDNVRFTGSAPIGQITLDANASTPVLGRADKLSVRLVGLPQDVGVKLSQAQGKASVASRDSAGNPVAIGQIEVAAWNDSKELPAGGAQGAVYRDVNPPSGPFRIGARVNQLKTLSVEFADAVQLSTETAGGPFIAAVETAALTGDVQILDLPTKLDLGVDLEGGQITYAGSAPIGQIIANLQSATPLLGDATAFRGHLQGIPQAFTIGLSPDQGNLSLTADAPISQIDLQAGSSPANFPTVPAGKAGATLDTSNGQFRLAARVFKLQEIIVDLEPISLSAKMEAGREFVVDALIDGTPTDLDLEASIQNLPASVKIDLVDVPAASGGGTRVDYTGSAPVDLMKLKATGLALLAGASDIQAEIESIPTAFSLALPDTGPVAALNVAGGQHLGQVRIKAGNIAMPADTLNPGTANDRIDYKDNGDFGIAARVTGLRSLSAQLDPIQLGVGSNTAINRPIDLAATLTGGGVVTGLLNKLPETANISVTTATGQPTRVNYSGSGGIGTLNLRAQNLNGLPLIDARVTSIPSSLAICFDSGDACIRAGDPGPARPRGGGNNYQPVISVDAVSNHTTGLVNLNGEVQTEPGGDIINIDNVRFRNLAFDLTQGNSQSILGQNVPRIAAYIDTNNAGFSIDNITYGSIENFGIGNTSTSNATAQNRFVWVRGFCASANPFDSCFPVDIDQSTSGSLNCGGRAILRVSGVNILDIPVIGQLVNLCSSGAP